LGEGPDRWRALKEVVVFVEGGGPGKSASELRVALQNGLFDSLRRAGRKNGIQLTFVACGGRDDTINTYIKAAKDEPHRRVLLVDSEGAVSQSPLAHLRGQGSGADLPADTNPCLMVQAIEAWFPADPDAIKSYFGPKAAVKEFETKVDIEAIPKDSLKPALHTIAKACGRDGYDESADQSPLLRLVSPDAIRSKSKHFALLWDRLSEHVGA